MIYDKTGAAFSLDHKIGGVSYVRPMVRIVTQSMTCSGDDFHEEEGFEPADFLVARNTRELFDAPPVALVDQDIAERQKALDQLIAQHQKSLRETSAAERAATNNLDAAKRQLAAWMTEHKVMVDLGKLLNGQVLYPLSVSGNHYHKARNIPKIPDMRGGKYLSIHSGDFEKGQKWVCQKYGSDDYGRPFMFFDTEEERAAVIASEFATTCDCFRKNPSFGDPSYTTTTRLSYTTLQSWVKTHPALSIPDDIEAMKADYDTSVAKAKREKLAAELAAMDTTT